MNLPFLNSKDRTAKLVLVSIHDSQAERWTRPGCAPAVGSAVRGFTEACSGGDKQMSSCPGDFTLYIVGHFDECTGVITPCDPVRQVNGLQVIQPKP